VEQARKAVRWANSAGILTDVSFIVGLPGETPETFQEVIKFIKEGKPRKVTISHLVPLPGSDIYEHPDKYGVRILHHDWDKYEYTKAVTETDTISTEMARELALEANNAYLENLSDAVFHKNKNIKSWRNPDGTVSFLSALSRKRYSLNLFSTVVWDILDEKKTVSEIMDHIELEDCTKEKEVQVGLYRFLLILEHLGAILVERGGKK
jgi:radical SAM superfamily enzyme YgiQ (UPF0313 family)